MCKPHLNNIPDKLPNLPRGSSDDVKEIKERINSLGRNRAIRILDNCERNAVSPVSIILFLVFIKINLFFPCKRNLII